ncbi:hypothetical protein ACMDCR_10180 [Labrys okinawensis]|uniref:hypothetical protein n=1 Tax=Labrys okinawensis TaxID=346911 RepID=UPI0039BC66CB
MATAKIIGCTCSILLVVGNIAPAQALCSEPERPACSEQSGAFDDQSDYEECLSQMRSYKSDVDDYLQCMKRESDAALQAYNEAVDQFNSRVNN